jgi:hypothetical protein
MVRERPICTENLNARTLLLLLRSLVCGGVILAMPRSCCCGEFPLAQFKEFVNTKATIMEFEFRVNSIKFQVTGLDPKAYRHFTFRAQNDWAYRLIEHSTEYALGLPRAGNDTRIIQWKARADDGWARFDGQFWSTFDNPTKKGVITALGERSGAPAMGPAAMSSVMANIAYDALNMGLINLRCIGGEWSGGGFLCPSNALGFRLRGRLELDSNGIPQHMAYSIQTGQGEFQYRASYVFSSTQAIPAFFPSHISIQRVAAGTPTMISDYEIVKLSLSDHKLTMEDVLLQQSIDSYAPKYVYTNNTYFRAYSNELVKLGAIEAASRTSYSKALIRVLLGCILLLLPCLLLYNWLITYKTRKQ